MGGNFREKLEEALKIKFCGLNFVCDIILSLADNIMLTLNMGHAMRILTSMRNAYPDSRRKESGYTRLEERWSASVSCLAWEAITSTKHELRYTPEQVVLAPFVGCASALLTSSITTCGTA